mmetsp:Transcript_135133/g.219835  ORF Transcript_135133/g.219835 Transcript_135133/m.219835 type:complete len:142 (-) Transcript_135133:489-914(-)
MTDSFTHGSCTVLVERTFQEHLFSGEDSVHSPSSRVLYQYPPTLRPTFSRQHSKSREPSPQGMDTLGLQNPNIEIIEHCLSASSRWFQAKHAVQKLPPLYLPHVLSSVLPQSGPDTNILEGLSLPTIWRLTPKGHAIPSHT